MKPTNTHISNEATDGETSGNPIRRRKRRFLPTTTPKTKALGVHFGKKDIAEYFEIEAEAHKLGMKPSDYARRLIRLGREVAETDPVKLLTAVYQD